jgi:hypothetical protein
MPPMKMQVDDNETILPKDNDVPRKFLIVTIADPTTSADSLRRVCSWQAYATDRCSGIGFG